MSFYEQNTTSPGYPANATTSKPDEDDSNLVAVILLSVSLFIICLVLLIVAVWNNYKFRLKQVRADTEKLTQIAPRNLAVLLWHDKAQRSLRGQIIELCDSSWLHSFYSLNVINVSAVTNVSLRQRYEQAYQTAQSTLHTWNLGATNMAFRWSTHDGKQICAVPVAVAKFEPGVLRQGEKHLFYHTDESELKAVLESEEEPAFRRDASFRMAGIILDELSHYGLGVETVGYGTRYMFVVRAITVVDTLIYDPDPEREQAGRTYRKSDLSQVLPEFLISYKVWIPQNDYDLG